MTMCASVLIQQLTHLVCISIALASLSETYRRLSYLLFGEDKKIQQEKVDELIPKTTYHLECNAVSKEELYHLRLTKGQRGTLR